MDQEREAQPGIVLNCINGVGMSAWYGMVWYIEYISARLGPVSVLNCINGVGKVFAFVVEEVSKWWIVRKIGMSAWYGMVWYIEYISARLGPVFKWWIVRLIFAALCFAPPLDVLTDLQQIWYFGQNGWWPSFWFGLFIWYANLRFVLLYAVLHPRPSPLSRIVVMYVPGLLFSFWNHITDDSDYHDDQDAVATETEEPVGIEEDKTPEWNDIEAPVTKDDAVLLSEINDMSPVHAQNKKIETTPIDGFVGAPPGPEDDDIAVQDASFDRERKATKDIFAVTFFHEASIHNKLRTGIGHLSYNTKAGKIQQVV